MDQFTVRRARFARPVAGIPDVSGSNIADRRGPAVMAGLEQAVSQMKARVTI